MANPSKVQVEVKAVERCGEGVYRVDLLVPRRFTRYRPGQFLHLSLDEFDPTTGFWPESRVFSIASTPRNDFVTVVYSVKGRYTRRMETELFVGKLVWIKFPYGDFVIDSEGSKPVVLVAGGTGVAPYLPFLLSGEAFSHPVYLYYGIRKPEHLLFREELLSLLPQADFRCCLFVEQGSLPDFDSRSGRLSVATIAEDLGDVFSNCEFYLSGPPVMIHNFKTELLGRAVEAKQIHIDEWE